MDNTTDRNKKIKDGISRRSFLKYMGIGAAAATVLPGCATGKDEPGDIPEPEKKGDMTYRVNHNTGDRVSLLGYGCMRLPTVSGESAQRSDS